MAWRGWHPYHTYYTVLMSHPMVLLSCYCRLISLEYLVAIYGWNLKHLKHPQTLSCAYYPITAESKFPSGDIESLPVPANVASPGSFVVKLCNINDVDKYDMTSVYSPNVGYLILSLQQAMLYTITSNVLGQCMPTSDLCKHYRYLVIATNPWLC